KSALVHEGKRPLAAHILELAQAEPEKDALLYPSVHAPLAVALFRRARLAAGQGLAQFEEHLASANRVFARKRLSRIKPFYMGLHLLHRFLRSIPAGSFASKPLPCI